jgi:hypothetical protein
VFSGLCFLTDGVIQPPMPGLFKHSFAWFSGASVRVCAREGVRLGHADFVDAPFGVVDQIQKTG